jgi:hypothetical protein
MRMVTKQTASFSRMPILKELFSLNWDKFECNVEFPLNTSTVSVVFSGVIFKTIVPKLFGRNALHTEVRFLKVDSLDALIKCEGKDDVVYVFC